MQTELPIRARNTAVLLFSNIRQGFKLSAENSKGLSTGIQQLDRVASFIQFIIVTLPATSARLLST
jgi:hypothetical protein